MESLSGRKPQPLSPVTLVKPARTVSEATFNSYSYYNNKQAITVILRTFSIYFNVYNNKL